MGSCSASSVVLGGRHQVLWEMQPSRVVWNQDLGRTDAALGTSDLLRAGEATKVPGESNQGSAQNEYTLCAAPSHTFGSSLSDVVSVALLQQDDMRPEPRLCPRDVLPCRSEQEASGTPS